jgi:transcriptional regulator with XRE-family HTH domain
MRHRNLASERVRVGMNQTECAEKLGVSVRQIVKYEADSDSMPGDFVKRAAEYFGCSSDYLLDLTDERKGTAVA